MAPRDIDPEILDLLAASFPWLPARLRLARRLGMRWASVPFVARERGRAVAHVGVLRVPMVHAGVPVTVAGVHAVGTHPAHRGRGHAARAVRAALEWCDRRYRTVQLTTSIPDFYRPFGFRVVAEHRFVGVATGGRDRPALPTPDAATVHRLLEARAPVSQELGVVRERDVFLFNEAERTLGYVADLDAIVSCEFRGRTLRLFDVVAPVLPPLEALLQRIPAEFDRVETYFASALAAEPHVLEGDDYLMVRGPYPPGPLMLPRTARH